MRTGRTRLAALAVLGIVVSIGIVELGAITFGWPDESRHPNVGALFFKRFDTPTPLRLCSGTLIAEDVFLTASHCTVLLDRVEAQGQLEWVGVSFATAGPHSQFYLGTQHTNPAYPGNGIDTGDVGVVVLDAGPTHLDPARLPTEGMFASWFGASRRTVKDLKFTAVGYGSLGFEFGGGPPVQVPSYGTRYYAYSSFAAMDKVWLHLLANEATGDGGTCYGDSGGPNFLWQNGAETNVIAGVTVTGDAMCVATNVIYRLDTAGARDFLKNYVVLP